MTSLSVQQVENRLKKAGLLEVTTLADIIKVLNFDRSTVYKFELPKVDKGTYYRADLAEFLQQNQRYLTRLQVTA